MRGQALSETEAACRDGETLQPSADLCQALSATCYLFKFLLSQRPERPQPAARSHAMLEGGLLKLAKLHCTAAQVHPWALDAAEALVPCLHVCVDIATRRGMGGLSWRTLTSRALRYIDLVLRSPHYHHMDRVVTLRPPVRPAPCARRSVCACRPVCMGSPLHGALLEEGLVSVAARMAVLVEAGLRNAHRRCSGGIYHRAPRPGDCL